jgi:hypothetical protein
MVAVAVAMASLGVVIAVLGTIAAINTWTDVDKARTDFQEAFKRVAMAAEQGSAALADLSRRVEIERKLEAQGIQLVEVDGDAGPEFLRYGDQLVQFPEPVPIPEPPTFLEESGGQILVAVLGAAIGQCRHQSPARPYCRGKTAPDRGWATSV